MFKDLKNLGNMANILREAGKMKERVETMQAELAKRTVDASAGGGMVKVRANGRQEIIRVEIEDEVLATGDKAMLQDLVAAATNAALDASREMARQEMSKITAGLPIDIPGLM